jgi:hypothetical protein
MDCLKVDCLKVDCLKVDCLWIRYLAFGAIALGLMIAPAAWAVPTEVNVYVLGHDSKFVGDHMGGMRITLRDAASKRILAKGLTKGESGNTDLILKTPHGRGHTFVDAKTAHFTATLDLAEPTFVELLAEGPLSLPDQPLRATSTQWLLPGKHLRQANGWLVEIVGLAVTVQSPRPGMAGKPTAGQSAVGQPAVAKLRAGGAVPVQARVTMLCGCVIKPGEWHWRAADFEVVAQLRRDGQPVGEYPLRLQVPSTPKEESLYVGTVPLAQKGAYVLAVVAYQRSTGNAGVDRVPLLVE